MKLILLTGVTGFLGNKLARALLGKGHVILATVRDISDYWRILDIMDHPNLHLINIDHVSFGEIFRKNKIKVVIHLATNYGRLGSKVEEVIHANLIFPIQLLQIAIKYKVDMFINTDSYFNKYNFTYSVLPEYSLSKKNFKSWLTHYAKDIHIANLVIEHMYGEGDSSSKFVENIIRKVAILQEETFLLTSGSQVRDFIHVDDVVAAYLCILENKPTYDSDSLSFEVGTSVGTSILDFARLVKEISSSPTSLRFGAIKDRKDEISLSIADASRLKALGWNCLININTGLNRTIDFYKASL